MTQLRIHDQSAGSRVENSRSLFAFSPELQLTIVIETYTQHYNLGQQASYSSSVLVTAHKAFADW